ncbi:glycoside hydrolase family 19 protein [Microvirga sesbaniae]|uniref:glycoside hydrolase family 19 protein n=1 Tax=Microvirga sesbaniae TaxID=681392 RepID=UPI0021C84B3E|nr:glycoside hydrolase family 19 protein [Microvirga sp. HBU67692]
MTTETFGRALNRASFFNAVRTALFGGKLTEGQVQGMDALLTAAPADMPLEHLAYCLATVYHETPRTMQPIKELGGGTYFQRMYDIRGDRPAKAPELGNLTPGDGARFAGRGYVQLTGKANYARASKEVGFDLVATPDLAMQPGIAAVIMYWGYGHPHYPVGCSRMVYPRRGSFPDRILGR